MDTAKIFENGKSQAVRLPKAYRLKGKEAFITRIGDAIVLLPKKNKWDSLISSLDKFSADFMSDRIQPQLENRERLFE
jgi:antitoxin VapB